MPDLAHRTGRNRASHFVAACLVATLAFWAYTKTLLPGVDLGDTGGFQAAVLWPESSARQAYPLYYQLARPFVRSTSPAEPARGLNLFSAVWGAIAIGMLTYLCAAIMDSTVSGVTAGLLLASSYTFWTQAIIAEVYTLHLALVGFSLAALRAYARRPGTMRLALFFAVYAVAFGNHLSMILLLVPCALFIVLVTPRPLTLLRPTIIALAVGIAAVGALQYLPNLAATWRAPDAPARSIDRLAAFWFDVTKADWRESMVFGIRRGQLGDRLGMWWFDARQQFGVAGLALAFAGAVRLWRTSRPWAAMLGTAFVISTAFAFTYNVGDTHVFFLPSHFVAALFAGAAVAWNPPGRSDGTAGHVSAAQRQQNAWSGALALVVIAYAGWRTWDTWPVVDRHNDRRGAAVIAQLSLGLSERKEVLVTQLDWQIENVLLYDARYHRRDIAWARLPDVLPHFPFLVEDNRAIGRDVVLTRAAAADVIAAYGSRYALVEDDLAPAPSLASVGERVPIGAAYVVALLTPPRDEPVDERALAATIASLTGGHAPAVRADAYQVIAGIAGQAPAYVRSQDRPFRDSFTLRGESMTIRMESWLPTDTFRRAGFGHVLRGHQRVLMLERGVNLIWIGPDGESSPPFYASGLYARPRRFRITDSTPRLAEATPPGHRGRSSWGLSPSGRAMF